VLRLARGPGRGGRAQPLEQGFQRGPRVADEAERVRVIAPDLPLVRVDLDDARPRLERHHGQPRPHREHHVRLVHVMAQRRVAPVGGAERERVVVADRALALGGLGHAGLQVLGDRGERVVRAGEMHAAARVDQRRARAEEHLGGAVHVARGRGGPGHLGGRQQLGEALVLHRLGRHLELDRARPARPQLDDRLAHRGGHVADL
jgi:hypothetical protein